MVATLLATCPGFYFRPHYFLLTLPVVALLAGCCVSGAEQIGQLAAGSTASRRTWPGVVFMLMLAANIFFNRQVWFELKPAQASRAIYGFDLFSQAEAAAALIRTNTPPDARVAVLESEPEIYFLSHRRSATGYIYTYALTELQPFARRMQKEMVRGIELAQPECVAVVVCNNLRFSRPRSDQGIFDWWSSYGTNYNLVHSFPIRPAPEDSTILIYLRKHSPSPTNPDFLNDQKEP